MGFLLCYTGKKETTPTLFSSHQNRLIDGGLIAAPEGMGNGGGPVRLGIVALEADVLVAVVLDLITGRVRATMGIPFLALLLLLVAVRVRVRVRGRVRVGTRTAVALALLVLLVLLVLALVVVTAAALVVLLGLDNMMLLLLGLVLLLLELVTLLLEVLLLVLESLTLGGGGALGLLLGLLLLLIVVNELVGQESSADGQETSKGGSSDISSLLLVGEGLDALLVSLIDMRGALDGLATRLDKGGVLAGDVVGSQGQVDLTLGFAAGGVDFKDTVEGSAGGMDDLVDGDGGKGNDGVGGGLLIHDLDKELWLAGEGEGERLVPGGGLAGILVDVSLLERFGVLEVGRELNIGVLLADGLDVLEVLGTMSGDRQSGLALLLCEHHV